MTTTAAPTVLVVEDDFTVRAIISRALQGNGYKVLQAGQGEEALQVCAKHGEPIDVAVVDVLLPSGHTGLKLSSRSTPSTQTNGIALMRRIMEVRPETKGIFMSGQSDVQLQSMGVLKEDVRLLRKPFNPDTLLRAIRDALNNQ